VRFKGRGAASNPFKLSAKPLFLNYRFFRRYYPGKYYR